VTVATFNSAGSPALVARAGERREGGDLLDVDSGFEGERFFDLALERFLDGERFLERFLEEERFLDFDRFFEAERLRDLERFRVEERFRDAERFRFRDSERFFDRERFRDEDFLRPDFDRFLDEERFLPERERLRDFERFFREEERFRERERFREEDRAFLDFERLRERERFFEEDRLREEDFLFFDFDFERAFEDAASEEAAFEEACEAASEASSSFSSSEDEPLEAFFFEAASFSFFSAACTSLSLVSDIFSAPFSRVCEVASLSHAFCNASAASLPFASEVSSLASACRNCSRKLWTSPLVASRAFSVPC